MSEDYGYVVAWAYWADGASQDSKPMGVCEYEPLAYANRRALGLAPAKLSNVSVQLPGEECTLCNGMGMLDGAGSICPHCDGRGKEPVLEPDADELHRGAWKDGYSAGFEAAKSWFTAQNVSDAADALRYRHLRDTRHNGYSLAGPAGVGNWHVIRKMREGEGEYFFGERLDAMVDGDLATALPAYVKQPITKEWCERMAGLEASSDCNIEAGVPEPMPASEAPLKHGNSDIPDGYFDDLNAPTDAQQDGLIEAANAVVERWHSKDWKQPHTAEFISRLASAIGAVKFGNDTADAARWRAFRARDEFEDLEITAFTDQFREDADDIIDSAIAATTNTP